MTRQLLVLRLIGGFFLLSGLFTLTFFTRAGGASPLALFGAALYLTVMVATGIGLLFRQTWARFAAIVALLYKAFQFLYVATRDARVMGSHSLDTLSTLAPYLTMVPITLLLAAAIHWLAKPSTGELFRGGKR